MAKVFQLFGASVIVYRGREVLLQRRRDNGCWGHHGGRVELGEVVEEAARRELFEETGLVALGLRLFGVFSGPEHVMNYPDGNIAHIIDTVYLCDNFEGELKCQIEELTDLRWFDIDQLPEDLSPPAIPVLRAFVGEKRWLVSPNLHFQGNCGEAVKLYEDALGADIMFILRGEDANPADYRAQGEARELVYHAEMMLSGQRIMMSDAPGAQQAMSLVIAFPSAGEVRAAFEKLSVGAKIITPMTSTSYSSCFVSLIDRFGMRWELMTERVEA